MKFLTPRYCRRNGYGPRHPASPRPSAFGTPYLPNTQKWVRAPQEWNITHTGAFAESDDSHNVTKNCIPHRTYFCVTLYSAAEIGTPCLERPVRTTAEMGTVALPPRARMARGRSPRRTGPARGSVRPFLSVDPLSLVWYGIAATGRGRRNGYACQRPQRAAGLSHCACWAETRGGPPYRPQKWVRTKRRKIRAARAPGRARQRRNGYAFRRPRLCVPAASLWTSLWKPQVIPAESGSAWSQNRVRLCADSGSPQRRIRYGALQKRVRKTAINPAKSGDCERCIRFTSS